MGVLPGAVKLSDMSQAEQLFAGLCSAALHSPSATKLPQVHSVLIRSRTASTTKPTVCCMFALHLLFFKLVKGCRTYANLWA